MFPFFSIAIPAYKDAYLKECLDSILVQSYPHFEIVIVNDASPYDVESIVKSYSDSRIHYFRNETNCGPENVVNNWNKCLEYVTGDYVICMGDDDILMPNCLQEYVNLMDRHPGLGVYHAWTELIDENSRFKNVTAARCEYESVYSFIWHRWNGRVSQYVGDFLYDVKLLRENGGFFHLPLAWGSDDITAIIAAKQKGIANTQKPCFCYRVSSNTISNTGSVDVKMLAIMQEQRWMEDFLEMEPLDELDKKYRICLVRQIEHHFQKKKGLTIAKDIRSHSLCRAILWIVRRKKYNIRLRTIVFAIIESYKQVVV